MRIMMMTLSILALAASLVMAAAQPSAGRGKELFNSIALGANNKSCASCHANGAGLKDASDYDDEKLGEIVNQCIAKALEGTPLPATSADLSSLVAYLKSLALVATP